MAGRRPKPTAVKVLAGNPGKRPLNASEPKPKESTARAPRGLGVEGARFWRRYVRGLAAIGVLTEADEPAAQLMSEHFEVAVRAATELRQPVAVLKPDGSPQTDKDGEPVFSQADLVVVDRDGNVRKNPLLQVLRDHSAAFRGYAVEFGMTPAARSKLHLPEEEQPSFADLFAKIIEGAHESADPLAEFMRDDEGA